MCDCKCKFYSRKCNSDQNWNNKCQCECKKPIKHHVKKKDYIWNPSTCDIEINYAQMTHLIDDLTITSNEIIDVVAKLNNDTPETVSVKVNNKNTACKINKRQYCTYFLISNRIVIRNRYYLKLLHNFVLIYDAAYKTPYNATSLCIIFDKVNGYIRKYDI